MTRTQLAGSRGFPGIAPASTCRGQPRDGPQSVAIDQYHVKREYNIRMTLVISRAGGSPALTPGVIVATMRGRPPKKVITEYPNRLRELRQDRGLSQRDLGNMVGEKYQTVSRHETGENEMTIAQLRAYADALGVKPEEMLNDTDRLNPRIRSFAALFDALPREQQDQVLRVVDALAEPRAPGVSASPARKSR